MKSKSPSSHERSKGYQPLAIGLCALIGFYLGARSNRLCPSNHFANLSHQDATSQAVYQRNTTGTTHRNAKMSYLEQEQAMHMFQEALLRQQQGLGLYSPSKMNCPRTLILPIDSITSQVNSSSTTMSKMNSSATSWSIWIESWEVMARALEVALSTDRLLEIQLQGDIDEQLYCANVPQHHQVYCDWIKWTRKNRGEKATCSLTINNNNNNSNNHGVERPMSSISPFSSQAHQGIEREKSDFFNTLYYGPQHQVVLPAGMTWPKTWLLDVGLSWERQWGAFWVRSQITHFLHDTIVVNNYESQHRSLDGEKEKEKMVLFLWDEQAQKTARQRFGRDNGKTHTWDRIFAIASHIREQQAIQNQLWTFSVLNTPTNSAAAPEIPYPLQGQDGWKISEKSRSIKDNFVLLEELSSADYLIGSFTSPWFRVGAALNLARNCNRYMHSEQRYWSLDVEWLKELIGY